MSAPEKIFSSVAADRFIGRGEELARLIAHAADGGILDLHAAPNAGSSELPAAGLRPLLSDGKRDRPILFRLRRGEALADMARRWAREFVTQAAAFRQHLPGLIAANPEIHELIGIVPESDRAWAESVASLAAGGASAESLLAVPFRAAADGVKSFVLVDEFDAATDETATVLRRILGRSAAASVLCFARRHRPRTEPSVRLHLDQLSEHAAGELVAAYAAEKHVSLEDEVRDLAVLLTGSRPVFLRAVVDAAAANDASLTTFASLAKVYTDELFGIGIGRRIDRELDAAAGESGLEKAVFERLRSVSDGGSEREEDWCASLGILVSECDAILTRLHEREFLTRAAGRVHFAAGDRILVDYLHARTELETSGKTRARVVAETLSANVARGPQLLARRYRRDATLGLRELLAEFAGQSVAAVSIDAAKFDAELKGRSEDEQLAHIAATPERFVLPQIFFTVHAADIYPSIGRVADTERTAIAFGTSASGDEMVWLAAEFDSKLAASLDLTEYWLDRLEMAAIASEFKNYRIWLITREGFDDAATHAIAERAAFGSTHRQIELLRTELRLPGKRREAAAYEVTIPMGGDTEIVAASFAEDIAERQGFSPRAINQIKTALVEACINAEEHSLSPDRKIRITLVPLRDRLEITVSNRGVRLKDRRPDGGEGTSERRGWGLGLIAKLSDSVEVLPTDDGTSLRITKYLS
ncbi:MAG: anti-sigma regulatory factor [Acidobacteria bacterium OLB17]|nr:MAG: anti-sigma regulatory factor [Acidobacteria bacterium OLB17]